jgi:hypothetical protein
MYILANLPWLRQCHHLTSILMPHHGHCSRSGTRRRRRCSRKATWTSSCNRYGYKFSKVLIKKKTSFSIGHHRRRTWHTQGAPVLMLLLLQVLLLDLVCMDCTGCMGGEGRAYRCIDTITLTLTPLYPTSHLTIPTKATHSMESPTPSIQRWDELKGGPAEDSSRNSCVVTFKISHNSL